MRLWSLQPKYLDAKGLVALWREALLAQHVLAGKTRGYRYHPQLLRFRESTNPLRAIGAYLSHVLQEAQARGYKFDGTKILKPNARSKQMLPVTRGQLDYEWKHLKQKLVRRSPKHLKTLILTKDRASAHPVFRVVRGDIEIWEKQP